MTQIATTLHGRPVMVNVMPLNFEAERQARFTDLFHTLDGTMPVPEACRERSLNM